MVETNAIYISIASKISGPMFNIAKIRGISQNQ